MGYKSLVRFTCIKAGNMIRLLANVIVMPMESNNPMLDIPRCEVKARLVKLHNVVSAL